MAKATKKIEEIIDVPEGIESNFDNNTINVKGPKGTLSRIFKAPIGIKVENKKIILSASKSKKREKKMLYTIKAHILNMFKGVKQGFTYKLQICFVHFPSTVTIDKQKNLFIIKNFLGEAKERTSKILPGVNASIEKDVIIISGCNIETTGQTAANLETATKIRSRDMRVFQDGIFISEKPGKE